MKYSALILLLLLIPDGCKKIELIEPAGVEVNVASSGFCFAVIGDYGYDGANEEKVADMIKSWNPDFIITTGDNNYFSGEKETLKKNISKYFGDYIYNFDAEEDLRCNGAAFDDELNRFFPCPGNHDNNSLQGIRPYLNYFTLPGNEEYYTFSWGDVAFYSLNSTALFIGEQEAWLEDELAGSTKKYNIVFFHHSPYSTGRHGNENQMQFDFQGMGVDLVFTGHDHIYSRIEKNDEPGLHYIICGAGGRSLYECGIKPLDEDEFTVNCFDADYGAVRGTYDGEVLKLEYFYASQPEFPVDSLVLLAK